MGMGSSGYKFCVLAKIVCHMKARYVDAIDHPLNLEELLDETNQIDAESKIKAWGAIHQFLRIIFNSDSKRDSLHF
jgi:hypothetical protein